MNSPEIILLAGPPGSGKTTIGEKFVELQPVDRFARHMSIGNLKRAITSGRRESKWSDKLSEIAHPDRRSGASHSEAMVGIMEEYLEEQLDSLTLVDGFPGFPDRIEPFKASMSKLGANVLALCEVALEFDDILLERLRARDYRPGQKVTSPEERLDIYHTQIAPTLDLLAESYPHYCLDGLSSPEFNAMTIAGIYNNLNLVR